MASYAQSLQYYDRYIPLIKLAASPKARWDSTFGAHVIENNKQDIGDLELLQYIYSVANDKEKAKLSELAKEGFSPFRLLSAIGREPVFKKNLIPMLSNAALQETREPGSTYVYRHPAMRILLKAQQDVYQNEMYGHPQEILQTPFLRNYVQSQAVPKTVKLITAPDKNLKKDYMTRQWTETDHPEGFEYQNGQWIATDPNVKLSDQDAVRLMYTLAPDNFKKRMEERFDENNGYSMNLLEFDMLGDDVLNQKGFTNILSDASFGYYRNPKIQPALLSNPTFRGLYEAQKGYYDQKIPGKQFTAGMPLVGPVIQHMPRYGVQAQTHNIMTGVNPELNTAAIQSGSELNPDSEKAPEYRGGGGDIKYVAPAMAVAAPVALLGGMHGGIGAGLGLLGLAGLAGYGYGYAQTRGWKGWEPVNKAGDNINSMFKGMKSPAKPKAPKTDKTPKAPATTESSPVPSR